MEVASGRRLIAILVADELCKVGKLSLRLKMNNDPLNNGFVLFSYDIFKDFLLVTLRYAKYHYPSW